MSEPMFTVPLSVLVEIGQLGPWSCWVVGCDEESRLSNGRTEAQAAAVEHLSTVHGIHEVERQRLPQKEQRCTDCLYDDQGWCKTTYPCACHTNTEETPEPGTWITWQRHGSLRSQAHLVAASTGLIVTRCGRRVMEGDRIQPATVELRCGKCVAFEAKDDAK